MKLREFNEAAREAWITAGHSAVKIREATHLSVKDLPAGAVLLEPFNASTDVAEEDARTEPIGSPVVDTIIMEKNGSYYQ